MTPSAKPRRLTGIASVVASVLSWLVAQPASAEQAPSPAATAGNLALSAATSASDLAPPAATNAWKATVRPSATAAAEEPEAQPLADSWLVPVIHGASLMVAMRIGAAVIWPEPFANLSVDRMGESYADAFSHAPRFDTNEHAFEWDGDPWYINVVGHGLFGSELFMRSRLCRRSIPQALALTVAGSTLWEYGFEASAVRPSALDLVYTPLAGLVLGEARYLGWNAARRIDDRGWRAVITALLDPLGELERGLGTRC